MIAVCAPIALKLYLVLFVCGRILGCTALRRAMRRYSAVVSAEMFQTVLQSCLEAIAGASREVPKSVTLDAIVAGCADSTLHLQLPACRNSM